MERKHFKCYACHKHNNFYIQINKIGNYCKSCGTFNYFSIKRNRNNNSRFNNNIQINQSEDIILNRQILINIIPNIVDENMPLLSSNNQNNIININYDTGSILSNEYNNITSFNKQNNSNINIYNDDNYITKFHWLKMQKANKAIIDKYGADYICPICYEKIKEKDNIHITKCKHFYHYICIEKAIDNNILDCPICRCNIRTGEQKRINNLGNNNIINEWENDGNYLFLNNDMHFIENNLINQPNNDIGLVKRGCKIIKSSLFWFLKILILIIYTILSILKKFTCSANTFLSLVETFIKIIYVFIQLIFLLIIFIFLIIVILTLINQKH
jgi:hypothetical protein